MINKSLKIKKYYSVNELIRDTKNLVIENNYQLNKLEKNLSQFGKRCGYLNRLDLAKVKAKLSKNAQEFLIKEYV